MQEKPNALAKQEGDTTALVKHLESTDITQDNYLGVMGVLVHCKTNLKALEAQRDEALNPAKETVNRIKAYFSPLLDQLEACERVIKEKATTYLGAQAGARLTAASAGQQVPAPPPAVEGVSLRESWDFKILNWEMLPRELLTPDLKAIRAQMKAQMTDEGPFTIPGVKFFRKQTIAVTPPKG